MNVCPRSLLVISTYSFLVLSKKFLIVCLDFSCSPFILGDIYWETESVRGIVFNVYYQTNLLILLES